MCGATCRCRCETGCVLNRVELAERSLRMSFTPRPAAESAATIVDRLIGPVL